MSGETRTVRYDAVLQVEAYRLMGVVQKFPNHFHDYYVFGFIEKGNRLLTCNSREYALKAGDVTIFNPRQPHTCEQVNQKPMDYRSINIELDVMLEVTREIFGKPILPHFSPSVLYRSELAASLRDLHRMIFAEEADFRKEELFFILMEQFIRECSDNTMKPKSPVPGDKLATVCTFLEKNSHLTISLDQLGELADMSKYHLLHSFTQHMGISPYSYLQTVRIGKAKKLLEAGVSPIQVAMETGFSDQSHFTNTFKKLIGLTPRQYMKIFIDEVNIKPSKELIKA